MLFESYIVLNDTCVLDLEHGDVVRNGLRISIPKKQLLLLVRLAKDLGHPVRSEELISFVWGSDVELGRNTLYQYVHRAREIIEKNTHYPRHLIPVKGMGYMLCPDVHGTS